jgi:hypothetical protein
MSQSEENSSTPLPIAGLVSLLLAVLAVVVPPLIPLESTRPSGNDANFLFQSIEDVDARLWQDPFAVAEQHKSDGERESPEKSCKDRRSDPSITHHDIRAFACSIESHASSDSDSLIIGVMVPGGPYAENAEQRMRIRYAVLSSLAVSKYAPEDSEHIGYFTTPSSNRLPDRMPFEWLNKEEKSRGKKSKEIARSVLLLWLDATAFNQEPTKRAKELKKYVDTAIKSLPEKKFNIQPKYLFIGPNTSGMLWTMVKEALLIENNGEDQSNSSISYKDIEFYNADATADDNVLSTTSGKFRSKLLDGQTFPKVLRTTLTDHKLAKKIIEELKLRGIDPSCQGSNIRTCNQLSKDNIVLVSEWDTFYGRRGLPTAIMKAMVCDQDNCDPLEPKWLAPNWVHQFSYMRGLDGVVPDHSNKESHEPKANKTTEKDKTQTNTTERPEGQSQRDYLRRMAERIEKLNQELGKNHNSEIRAVGVLGSDAYDKLLVLKALRPKFPNVIFFTTDLDSRLMNPEDIDATKNLVVASSFGLQLRHELQKNIPPFRDSRQTAYFFATQIALRNQEAGKNEVFDQEAIDKLLKPRVFELGLHSPVDLSPPEKNDCNATSIACCKTLETCSNIYPQPENAWHEWKPFLLVLFIIALALAFSKRLREVSEQILKNPLASIQSLSSQNKKSQDGPNDLDVWVFLGWSFLWLALPVLVITALEMLSKDNGEPFAWANGVSLWPSEIIRLFAGMLGCFFIAKSINDLQEHKKHIKKVFLLPSYTDISQENKSPNKVIISDAWRHYCLKLKFKNFFYWVLKATLIFAVLSFMVIYAFGFPYVPYRGLVSLTANFLTLLFVVSVLLILVMIAVNVTRNCVLLIDAIAPNASLWPQNTLTKFGVVSSAIFDQLYDKLNHQGIDHQLQDWIDIDLISELTHSVRNVAYYPFIVLTLMGISRSRIFDNWDLPIGLLLVYILCFSLIVGSKLYLRYKAEEARCKVVNQLESISLALGNSKEDESITLEKQIAQAIARIKAFNRGAYMPLTQEPAIQAMLLPLGGWGGVTLLQYLSMLGAS